MTSTVHAGAVNIAAAYDIAPARVRHLLTVARTCDGDPIRNVDRWLSSATADHRGPGTVALRALLHGLDAQARGRVHWLDRTFQTVELSNVLPLGRAAMVMERDRFGAELPHRYEQIDGRRSVQYAPVVTLHVDHDGPPVGMITHRSRDARSYWAQSVRADVAEAVAFGQLSGASWAGKAQSAHHRGVDRIVALHVRELSVVQTAAQHDATAQLGKIPPTAVELGTTLAPATPPATRAATPASSQWQTVTHRYPGAAVTRVVHP